MGGMGNRYDGRMGNMGIMAHGNMGMMAYGCTGTMAQWAAPPVCRHIGELASCLQCALKAAPSRFDASMTLSARAFSSGGRMNAASPRTFRRKWLTWFLINGRSYEAEQVAEDEKSP